jgi:hypothetical protein
MGCATDAVPAISIHVPLVAFLRFGSVLASTSLSECPVNVVNRDVKGRNRAGLWSENSAPINRRPVVAIAVSCRDPLSVEAV